MFGIINESKDIEKLLLQLPFQPNIMYNILVYNFLFGILMNNKDNLVILLANDDFKVLHHKIHILAERENIMGSSFYFFLIQKKKKKAFTFSI